MFTIEQIKAAHTKVKSGADFPAYIQEMKTLGVLYYEHFISDGHIKYYGPDDFTISANAKWTPIKIAETGSADQLKYALKVHQAGQTDYLTFCNQSAEAGVERWIVDLKKMTCTYYDKTQKEMVVEVIPSIHITA